MGGEGVAREWRGESGKERRGRGNGEGRVGKERRGRGKKGGEGYGEEKGVEAGIHSQKKKTKFPPHPPPKPSRPRTETSNNLHRHLPTPPSLRLSPRNSKQTNRI